MIIQKTRPQFPDVRPNLYGGFSASQRCADGRLCVADAQTRAAAMRDLAEMVIARQTARARA